MSKIKGFRINNENVRYQDENIADEYSPTKTYSAEEYVMYEGQLYKAQTAVPNADNWAANSSHFIATTIGENTTNIKNDLDILNQGGLVLEENFIANEVDTWLAAHPSIVTAIDDNEIVTTMLNDECVTEEKIDSELIGKMKNGYITPQQFGAVGDGITDDTQAFQNACDYAAANDKTVVLITDYYITETIIVPSFITIISFARPQYRAPRIYVASDINIAFSCTVGNYFENITIRPKQNTWQPITAFYVSGNAQGNADTDFHEVHIAYCEIGILGYGRNIYVIGGSIGHCRYGIKYYRATDTYAYRGMIIRHVRFHGIGEELEVIDGQEIEMLLTGNTACIYLELDYTDGNAKAQISDVIIEACHADQGGTFVKGQAQFLQITNNYVKTFEMPAIVLEGTTRSQGATALIADNLFIGCQYSDGIGVNHENPPATLLSIKDSVWINVKNNIFTIYSGRCIILENSSIINISGNFFAPLVSSDPAVNSINNSSVILESNVCRSPSTILYAPVSENDTAVMISCKNNIRFSFSESVNYQTSYVPIHLGSYTAGTPNFPYRLLNTELMIRRNDSVTMFRCMFNTNHYFSSTVHSTGTEIEWLSWNKETTAIFLNRYTFATGEHTQLGLPLEVYQLI